MLDYIKQIDWKYLVTSMEGRIARKDYWIGVIAVGLCMTIVSTILSGIVGAIFNFMFAATLSSLIAAALVPAVYPVTVKRANDRGRPALFVMIPLAVLMLGYVFQALAYTFLSITLHNVGKFLFVLGIAGSVYMLVDFGVLKGQSGANAHGPDPLAGV